MRTNTGQILYIPKIGQRADFQHPLMRGCVGWWPLTDGGGGIARDILDRNNGTIVNSSTYNITDRGLSLYQTGTSSQKVDIASGNRLNFVRDCTVSAWVSINSGYIGNYRKIAVLHDGAGIGGFYLSTGPSNFPVYMGVRTSSSVSAVSTAGNYLTANVFTHLVGTYDGTNIRLYRNGIEDAINSQTGDMYDSSKPVVLGAYYNGAESWPGYLQNIRMWNRSLSSSEVFELYINPWAGLSVTSSTSYFFVPQLITASPKLFSVSGSSVSMRSNAGRVSVRAAR